MCEACRDVQSIIVGVSLERFPGAVEPGSRSFKCSDCDTQNVVLGPSSLETMDGLLDKGETFRILCEVCGTQMMQRVYDESGMLDVKATARSFDNVEDPLERVKMELVAAVPQLVLRHARRMYLKGDS